MNYTIIALIFIIVFMLYLGYTYYKNMGTITTVLSLSETTDVDKTTIKASKISNPNSSTFHYEGWLYLNEMPSKTAYNIICSRENDSTPTSYTTLELSGTALSVATASTTSGAGTGTDTSRTEILSITTNFPIQKWVYVVVNVFENKQIEAYLNGKLVITTTMDSKITPKLNGDVRLCNSSKLNGYITLFRYDSTALSPDAVWKKYLSGNGMMSLTNWLAGYNASFTISQNMEQIRKYTLL